MPNKFGRAIAVADYNPHAILPDGLAPVARPDGSADLELAAGTGKLANTFNAIADEAATSEGKAAGNIAGNDPSFRPTGNVTLRGKAYDDAGVKSYVDRLDAQVRTDIQTTYEANKDDPAALRKAFDKLQSNTLQKDVFPEIQASYQASFARLRMPYQNKALTDLQDRQKDEGKADLIDNITSSQTNVARAAAADPAGVGTSQVVATELTRMDALIDGAVENKSITAAAGAQLKIKNRNDVTTGAAVSVAQSLKTAEEVAAYREKTRVAFADGKFKNLSGDGYTDLDAKLEQVQKAKRTETNAGETLLSKNVGDYVQRAADGFPVSPDEWTRFASSDAAKTPKGEAILTVGQAKLTIANVLRNRSVEDGELMVSRMRSELARDGSTSASQAEIFQFAQKYVKDQRTALNTDQLGLAQQKQLIPAVSPVDFQGFAKSTDEKSAAALALQFRDRTAQARAVGTEMSRAPQFLRPEEKDRLKEIVDQGGPKALALAGAIVKGADQDAPAILREISNDAPLLAQAGNIIASGGSLSAARDAFDAARMKAATGKELQAVSPTVTQKAVRDTFGTAFSMQGEDGGRIRTTADAIARTRIERGGVDPKSSEAEKIYTRALQESAGATFVDGVQYGGVANYKPGYFSNYKVPVPGGVRADAFRDVIRSIRDDDLKTLPVPPVSSAGVAYSAQDIAGGVPIAVRGGYRFALGDPSSNDPKYIRGADGNPFVLPFDALEPTLRNRIPKAFLGSR